jgi:bidirectional [NiFe] hydrogenase diaphorase subunit
MATAAAPPATKPKIDVRRRILDTALKRHGFRQDALIEVLHTMQNAYGYLTPERLWYVAQQLRLPPSQVYGVATFYNFFTLRPPGEHTLTVCEGTACYIKGSTAIRRAVEARFGVQRGQTTPDGRLSFLVARCLGSCSLAPVCTLDGTVHGRVDPEKVIAIAEEALARPATAPAVGNPR